MERGVLVNSGVAATCYGANCSYRDPVEAGCNAGAVTSDELRINHIRVEKRYSSACHASWARMTILTPNLDCGAAGAVWQERLYSGGEIGRTPNACYWTQMQGHGSGGGYTRSCGTSVGKTVCTRWWAGS
ncbi:Protein of unknown function [Amycolatopsis keratiniphila]|nr:Protein of unknown function [Amycolatopsis keratiniphila]